MSRFQLIFTGILVVLGVGGAILFAVAKNQGTESAPETVMWGTLDDGLVSGFLSKVSIDNRDALNVSYVEKGRATFEADLVAALARGQGPDLVLLPQDLVVRQLDKFYVVPFESYSERDFKTSFIEEGELYLVPGGIVGFPFSVDPIVMYWNRDMFTNAGVALPPGSWDEFFSLSPKFVKKDASGNVSQSFVAFGEARNVSHAKDMLALLALQAGNDIVAWDATGRLESVFDRRTTGLVPAEQALAFYTEFSNPTKPSYSWNRSLANDRSAFVAGRLALYFGYASEVAGLRAANPNLNFDVAPVPQAAGKKATFGRMNAVAVLKSSPHASAAYGAAVALSGAPLQAVWVEESGFPPVRRDMLSSLPGDAYKAVSYESALISRAWLDPNPSATDGIFMRLVENVTSGKSRVSEAVRTASLEIGSLLRSNI